MLRIFGEIAKREPRAILVWCGYIRDDCMEHIQNILLEENIKDRVVLLGRCTNVNEWMQAFDVFLFPSIYEGLGIVVIEAQAAGLQCVISNTIPQEANISDLITVCQLEERADVWAETVLKHCRYERTDHTQAIIEAGYDIRSVAADMQQFYQRIASA